MIDEWMAWITKAYRRCKIGEIVGGYLLILHFLDCVELFVACLTEHFAEDLACVAVYDVFVLLVLPDFSFCLTSVKKRDGVGDLDGEHGYPFIPGSSFLGWAAITYLNATIVFWTNRLVPKMKPHFDGTPTAD